MEEHLATTLTATLPFHVAWGHLGDGTDTPRAVVHRVSGVRDMTLDGPALMRSRVQVDCYGKSFTEAIGASRAVRAVLEGYRGGPILGCFLTSVRDGSEEDVGILHRVSLTFEITSRD